MGRSMNRMRFCLAPFVTKGEYQNSADTRLVPHKYDEVLFRSRGRTKDKRRANKKVRRELAKMDQFDELEALHTMEQERRETLEREFDERERRRRLEDERYWAQVELQERWMDCENDIAFDRLMSSYDDEDLKKELEWLEDESLMDLM